MKDLAGNPSFDDIPGAEKGKPGSLTPDFKDDYFDGDSASKENMNMPKNKDAAGKSDLQQNMKNYLFILLAISFSVALVILLFEGNIKNISSVTGCKGICLFLQIVGILLLSLFGSAFSYLTGFVIAEKNFASKDSEIVKTILVNRIYPAKQSSISARYKTLVFVFIFFSILVNSSKLLSLSVDKIEIIKYLGSLLLLVIVFFNSINYASLVTEEARYEGRLNKMSVLNSFFSFVQISVIWLCYAFL